MTSPFQVVFPVGSVNGATQDVKINIHPDSALEGDHHFNVTLLESPQYVLGSSINRVITIEDGKSVLAVCMYVSNQLVYYVHVHV